MSDNKKMAAKAYEENKKMLSLADKALAKAKKIEKQKMKKGWKYVQVGDYTQILVPCDEKGQPTPEAQAKIESFAAAHRKY